MNCQSSTSGGVCSYSNVFCTTTAWLFDDWDDRRTPDPLPERPDHRAIQRDRRRAVRYYRGFRLEDAESR